MNEHLWHVGIDTWIIQDGNYDDFQVGQVAEFALEYYAERGLLGVPTAARRAELADAEDARYRITGDIVEAPAGVCVLDFGVRAYREEACGADAREGVVSGEIYLGIDPFFYFESLARRDSMPALIYTWRVERILQLTAPLVRVQDGRIGGVWSGHNVWTADLTRRVAADVDATDAWRGDGNRSQSLNYTLCCRRLDVPPKHARSVA